MKIQNFQEYISHLRDSVQSLQDYRVSCGNFDEGLNRLDAALNHRDPFVVFEASSVAAMLFADKRLYH